MNFTVRIITSRNDGALITVKQLDDGRLEVIMKSTTGAFITADNIQPGELAQWIHDHHDW